MIKYLLAFYLLTITDQRKRRHKALSMLSAYNVDELSQAIDTMDEFFYTMMDIVGQSGGKAVRFYFGERDK
jgi:hypothetical protein